LADFLQPFHIQFCRRESQAALERYLTGLLTDHPRKNCDTLAAIVPGTSEQQLQGLLTTMQWDAAALNRQRVERMLTLPTAGDAVLIFDDTGFLKQGHSSVGVSRQYTGTAGKVTNCQVAVTCQYAERIVAWPIAARLYLSEEWCADTERRTKAHIPAEVQFQTKPKIALALLDQARDWGIPHACVTADADYGDNPNFLDHLETRDERYVVAIRADFRVAVAGRGGPQLQRVDAILTARANRRWRTIRWREGSRGWLAAEFHAVRAWRQDAQGQWHGGWLIGERPLSGTTGESAYYWSNFPTTAPLEVLVEYAHRRHHIERFHQDAKDELGWDQYQGRLWPGFHRHAALVMLSYSFLVWQEWQQRHQQLPTRGRPRGAFSPSAPSPPLLTRNDSSAGLRGTTVSGHRRTHPNQPYRSVSATSKLTK
jgi:SRSO17 transposase